MSIKTLPCHFESRFRRDEKSAEGLNKSFEREARGETSLGLEKEEVKVDTIKIE